MKLGTLTAALGDLPLDEACGFLAGNGVQMVEIGCGGFPVIQNIVYTLCQFYYKRTAEER